MKKFLVSIIFSGLVMLFTGPVWAHAHGDSPVVKGPHGGHLVAAGHYHFELLAKDGELRLYITDHNNREILAAGGSGKANIFDKDGSRVSVELVPVYANFMKGTGDFKITPETTISVFAVVEHTQTNAARFTSLVGSNTASSSSDAKAKEEEAHEHHHEGDHAKEHGDAEAAEEHKHDHEQDAAEEHEHAKEDGDASSEEQEEDNSEED